jgi:NAD(P)-dependent dehydrogenase (short-subunit alcohol dehydrogenase family)
MDLGHQGKRVLVTGSSKGIGYSIALSFAQQGAHVILNGRDASLLGKAAQQIAEQSSDTPEIVLADLSNADGVSSLVTQAGHIDILVNNAGAIPSGDLASVDDATWRRAWDLKVFGYIDMIRHVLPQMQARRSGVIVNIIGMAGRAPRADYICGSMGNAALISFTQAMGGSTPEHGVRLYGVNPSATRSDRIETIMRAQAQRLLGDPDKWYDLTQKLAFGRLAEPEEVADLVVFTASPRCSYLSGTVIDVDGGMLSRDTKASH